MEDINKLSPEAQKWARFAISVINFFAGTTPENQVEILAGIESVAAHSNSPNEQALFAKLGEGCKQIAEAQNA